MAIQKTEALVLRTQPFRTSSLIVTVFSRSFGKVKGVVKGVRQEGAGRPSAFEPFTLLEVIYYEKLRSDLHLISEFEILETFNLLSANLQTLATAYYLTELVDQLTELHDPHEKLFDLLYFSYRILPTVSALLLARYFEIRILLEIGLLPHLQDCLVCGGEVSEKVYLSSRQGGALCSGCAKKFQDARRVMPETIETLRHFASETDAAEAVKRQVSEKAQKEIGKRMEGFILERTGKKLSSRRFLSQVEALHCLNWPPGGPI